MKPDQFQALANKSLAGSGGIAVSGYIDEVRMFFQSLDNFVGIYYDTLFMSATFLGVFSSVFFYYISYKLKKERHEAEMEILKNNR